MAEEKAITRESLLTAGGVESLSAQNRFPMVDLKDLEDPSKLKVRCYIPPEGVEPYHFMSLVDRGDDDVTLYFSEDEVPGSMKGVGFAEKIALTKEEAQRVSARVLSFIEAL